MNEKTRHVVFNKEPGMQLSTKPNQGIFSLSTEEVSKEQRLDSKQVRTR
nr:hypothetical protein [Vibrio parahaemolyticus]